MNCPTCKNPVQANDKECEWCGSEIEQSNSLQDSNIKLFFAGDRLGLEAELYIDNVLKYQGPLLKGFSVDIKNLGVPPIIRTRITSYRWSGYQIIKLPQLDLNKDYFIELEYSRFWGNFRSIPKIIK